MAPAAQPFWIDVYGSELGGLRVKAAAALAARAALDGHRVLLTERGGGQLRRGLPAALRPGGGLELFHPRGMPKEQFAVAVAAAWDEERERAFAAFAAAFDAVVCCRAEPAGGDGAAVVAGAWDGAAAAAAAGLCERLPGAVFVAVAAARRPGSHAATAAAARAKHPAFAAGRELPLLAHEPLRPPGSDEVGGEPWTGVAELLADLGLPARRERSGAAPDAALLAAARPLDAAPAPEPEPARVAIQRAGEVLAARLDADGRFAARLAQDAAAMDAARTAGGERRTQAAAAAAAELAAAAARRTEARERRRAAEEERRTRAAAQAAAQWRELAEAGAARRAEAAARLQADLDGTLLRHRRRSEEEAAAIEERRRAEEEERRAAAEARAAARRAAEEEARRAAAEQERAARAKEEAAAAAQRAAEDKERADEAERERAAAARKEEEEKRAAAERAGGDALIKRRRAADFVPIVDRAKLRELLAPQDLDGLIDEVNAKNHAGVGRPDRQAQGGTRARFARFRDFYAQGVTGHMRERGADFVCANIALVLAGQAAAEEDHALEAGLRDLAMDIFCAAADQPLAFSLRHWFLNTVWLAERCLHEGDPKRVAAGGGRLAEALFKARPGLDGEEHLRVMRAVLGLLLNKVEAKAAGAEDPDAHEYERMLLADLDEQTAAAVFLDREEAAAARAAARIKDQARGAREAFGSMADDPGGGG